MDLQYFSCNRILKENYGQWSLITLFNSKYFIEVLKKGFQSLRACMSKELKNESKGN